MIEVIKHGYMRYYTACFKCHCQFKYELSDISENGRVRCPDCGYEHIHSDITEYDVSSLIEGAVDDK